MCFTLSPYAWPLPILLSHPIKAEDLNSAPKSYKGIITKGIFFHLLVVLFICAMRVFHLFLVYA